MFWKSLPLVAALMGSAAILSAQAVTAYADTYKVGHFSVGPFPFDETVNITNVGTSGGNICADIYVFDIQQELAACCSCLLTPHGLDGASTYYSLANNPLTGGQLLQGTIAILSAATTAGTCPFPTAPKPTPGIRAWGTVNPTSSTPTETQFLDSGLSAPELKRLGNECSAIALVGSGAGVCGCEGQ